MVKNWRLTVRLFLAKILIKLGRLTHADYSSDELNEFLSPHLPETFEIEVPAGNGQLTLLQANVRMRGAENGIQVQLLSSFQVESLGNPIYRAHLIVQLKATPVYIQKDKVVKLKTLEVREIELVNDEYSVLKDTQELLSNFVPKPFQSLLTGTMKSAFGILTGGGTDAAANYLKLYLSGSKQRILEYHKPQLTSLVSALVDDEDFQYRLDESDWQEHLFACYGKEVVVEEGQLRFKF